MKAVVVYEPPADHLEALRRAAPGWRIVPVRSIEQARAEVVDATAFLGNRYFLQSLPFASNLRWMQSNSAGMDVILAEPAARAHPFVLTATRGVYDDEMADHAVALLYALVRDLRCAIEASRERWERRHLPHLAGKSVLVFGFGGVGRGVTRRLQAAGARVSVVRRRPETPVSSNDTLGLVCLDPTAGMAALSAADAVVLALPLTPETRGMFDARALGRLQDGAFFVNVARGALVPDDALLAHVDRLGGVGLDVFENEPLPADHWLWTHPKAILTPHVARSPDAGAPPWLSLFEHNLRAFAAGAPLLHVVDKELGY